MRFLSQRGAVPARPAGDPLQRALVRATAVATLASQLLVQLDRLPPVRDPAEREHTSGERAYLHLFGTAMTSGAELIRAALGQPDRPADLTAPCDADTMLVLIWAAGLTDRLDRYGSVLRAGRPELTDPRALIRVAALRDRTAALLLKVQELERDLLDAAGITGPEELQ